MSHWIKTKTKMIEKKHIMAGLEKMGFNAIEGGKIRTSYGYGGRTEEVDIKINDSVGLKQQEDGSWALEGDFYGTKHQKYYNKENQFIKELQGQYCVAKAKAKIADLGGGWVITDNEEAAVDEDGFIIMRAQSFAD
jgi:hypothetical protein